MKKQLLVLSGALLSIVALRAQDMRHVELQEVEVSSTRADEKTPVAYSEIGKEQLKAINTGKDLPFLLTTLPSIVATSEAGAGIGYTGIRIRGTDATRINVTANGIPVNDSESQSVFWVNMGDITASLQDIQVQRGVGTSTNGAGAFGGSINLQTESLSLLPYGEVSGSYGSFNTHRESVNIGTGLIGDSRWAINARLSNIGSDGYIDRASTSLKSYFFQVGWFGNKTSLKFINFAGKEKTYHAWNAISLFQLENYGRKFNTSGLIDYNKDTGEVYEAYKDQTDNYTQSHYQILMSHRFNPALSLSVNLHYTDGEGYYEEYKKGRNFTDYALTPFDVDGVTTDNSDLVRRKNLNNGFGGGVFSLDFRSDKVSASLGGAANHYDGDHYGNVLWVRNYLGGSGFLPNHEYYRNKGKKTDANIYARANWNVTGGLYLYGDVQYRHVKYTIDGRNDKYDSTLGGLQVLDVHQNYNFFNPKAGVTYDFAEKWSAYASFAVAHKEPTRNNFTDAETHEVPKAERLMDYEAGVNFRSGIFSAGVNFYYMKYKDQLILNGKLNHIGEPLASNVPDSYRAGIEVVAAVQPLQWLRWDINTTLSSNKIKNYEDHLFDWSFKYEDVVTNVGKTTIAYSPSVLVNSLITADYRNWRFMFQSNYVGKQYLTNFASKMGEDNTFENDPRKLQLDSYFLNNLKVDYTFSLRGALKSVVVGVAVNNIFDVRYSSNGAVGSWYGYNKETDASGNKVVTGRYRVDEIYVYPQAGINFMANIALRF